MTQLLQIPPSRSRAPNFTLDDQELLIEVMKPYLHIIECKKTDHVKLNQKSEAWTKVTSTYNTKTKNVSRSVDNLISCYRNMKSKLKKQHTEVKQNITDSIDKDDLVNGVEVNREDLATLAKNVNKCVDLCKAGLRDLEREYRNYEILHKKKMMGIGGGLAPDKDCNILNKLQSEPHRSLHTNNGGDIDFQDNSSEEDEMKLVIDFKSEHDESEAEDIIPEIKVNPIPSESIIPSMINIHPILNSQEMFRATRDPSLNSRSKIDCASKKTGVDSFQCLTEAKRELVNLQMELVTMEIKHKKKIQELELKDMMKENNFKDELRQKRLELLDLEIKKMTE